MRQVSEEAGQTITTDSFGRFGLLMARLRWPVLIIWLLVIAVSAALLAPRASGVTKGGGFTVDGTGSFEARTVLAEELGASTLDTAFVVFHSDDLTVQDPAYRADVEQATERLSSVERVISVFTFYNTLDDRFVVPDGRTTFALVRLSGDEDQVNESIPDLRDELEDLQIETSITGLAAVNYDTFIVSEEDLRRSEVFTIPIVIVLLLIVFRTVISAAIPLVLGAASVLLALSIIFFIGSVIDTSIFALNVASMIGLGLSIDFSLIVVSRFRDERARGLDNQSAIAVTMATAGRSILYSAVTVVLSMLVLTLVLADLMIVRSISLGVMLVAGTGLLLGMTFLPAVLVLLGHRIEWLRVLPRRKTVVDDESGFWYRFSHAVMRRPWPYLLATTVFLLILAWPALNLKMTGAQTTSLPSDTESVIGAQRLEDGFDDQRLTPIQIVIETPEENGIWTPEFLNAVDELTLTLQNDPRVDTVDSLATYFATYPRDGRYDHLTPSDLDVSPQFTPDGQPILPGIEINEVIDVIVADNPLEPDTAPTYMGLARFQFAAGDSIDLVPTQSLNILSVETGSVIVAGRTPLAVLRVENRADLTNVEQAPPGTQIDLGPLDQLIVPPLAELTIAASEPTSLLTASLFIVRAGQDAANEWLAGSPAVDAFDGHPRTLIGGGVGLPIPSENMAIKVDQAITAPDGYFQRHVHPGPELIAVESGSLTIYATPEMTMTQADGSILEGPYDTPVELQAGGKALVLGFSVHRANNFGSEPAVVYSMRVTDATLPPFVPVNLQEAVAQRVDLARGSNASVVTVIPDDGQYEGPHQQLVYDIREQIVPNMESLDQFEVSVGGDAANYLDFQDSLYGRFAIIVLSVALINFIILMMFFQSIVLPIKAILLNLIGIGASIGVLVLIFQHGWLSGLFRFESEESLNVITPVILYVILFALSTDYEVFMLSRVKEIYAEIGDNEEAVARGLQQTAGIITAAGLILIGTFGSFATAQVIQIKQIGLGLAIAVLIDSTIIRIVMVPATMRLMGDINWWMPGWLQRIVPEISEGPSPQLVPAGAAAGAGSVPVMSMSGEFQPVPGTERQQAQATGGGIGMSVPAPPATLRPTTDALGVSSIPLSATRPLTIGRDEENVLQLFDMRISRFHARIEMHNGQFTVIDLNSSNGIFVNGNQIPADPERTILRHGDLIEIGNMGLVTLAFEENESGVDPTKRPEQTAFD